MKQNKIVKNTSKNLDQFLEILQQSQNVEELMKEGSCGKEDLQKMVGLCQRVLDCYANLEY